MSILKIARMGHPVLRVQAEAVEDPTEPEIRRLVGDMIETMLDANGRGLAANQVHVPKQVVVYIPPGDEDDDEEEGDGGAHEVAVLINPQLEPLTEELEDGWEGCLSVPDMRGIVPRATRVRLRATGLDGSAIDQELAGFHARVVQHECDHLKGILYPMRMH
ncbi:MAG: peptide deformylase, partial [Proteobacteria bacterium]|nr:peptide deformylase [Pseudomonadota bacterium]